MSYFLTFYNTLLLGIIPFLLTVGIVTKGCVAGFATAAQGEVGLRRIDAPLGSVEFHRALDLVGAVLDDPDRHHLLLIDLRLSVQGKKKNAPDGHLRTAATTSSTEASPGWIQSSPELLNTARRLCTHSAAPEQMERLK